MLAVLLSGCGGGGPKTDADAIAQVLKAAASAAADGQGDKACGYLTADAQRQAVLQTGAGVLGGTSCSTAVGRAQLILTPLERRRIKGLQPANVMVNGTQANATLAGPGASPGQNIALQVTLRKLGGAWKISGFSSQQGLPTG